MSDDPAVTLSEIVRNYGLVVAGAIGLLIATWRGYAASRQAKASLDQVKLDRRAHFTEVFGKAVEQLGSPRVEIRLGAFYTLKQIGEEFPELAEPIFELLSAYVRERSAAAATEEAPVDIREIMDYLGTTISEEGP